MRSAANEPPHQASPPLGGRIALVTGAGRGIGRATALGLADDGATVIVNDRDDAPAHDVVAEITARGGSARPMVASVTDYRECAQMVGDLVDELGGVDIFVSNAGFAASGRSLLRTPLDEAESLMQVNTFAALSLCQAVLPSMRERGGGSIVMISSMAVSHMLAKCGPYNMAKAALEALAQTLANEERRHRIRANIIQPGFVDTRLAHLYATRISRATAPSSATAGQGDEPLLTPSVLLAPDAIADAVRFYVSDAASHVTGQLLVVA